MLYVLKHLPDPVQGEVTWAHHGRTRTDNRDELQQSPSFQQEKALRDNDIKSINGDKFSQTTLQDTSLRNDTTNTCMQQVDNSQTPLVS